MVKFRVPLSFYAVALFYVLRFTLASSLLYGMIVDGILITLIHFKLIKMLYSKEGVATNSFWGKLLNQYTFENDLTYSNFWLISVMRLAAFVVGIIACGSGWWVIVALLLLFLSTAHFVYEKLEDDEDEVCEG